MLTSSKTIRRLFYWGLPIAILYVVFQKIDLEAFRANLAQTDVLLVCVALLLGPIVVSIGAIRWNYMLRKCISSRVGLHFSSRHYWIGLALGMFVPGGLGWDAYRVMAVGRRFGRYNMNMGVIVAEKLMALIVCMLLIVLLYPVVSFSGQSQLLTQLFDAAVIVLGLGVAFVMLVVIMRHYRLVRPLLERVERRLAKLVSMAIKKVRINNSASTASVPIRDFLSPLTMPRHLPMILLFSFLIQLVTAIGSQLFFVAAGYDIPFMVNLFVTPILFFVFLLPVSFGGLGVREVAYIFFYGLFGVPAETALLVSFFALAGILLNNLIGAVVVALQRNKVDSYGSGL